jgi:hypothetical protein
MFCVNFLLGRGPSVFAMFFRTFLGRSERFRLRGLKLFAHNCCVGRVAAIRWFWMELPLLHLCEMFVDPSQRLPREQFDRGSTRCRKRRGGALLLLLRMSRVVLFEILENVAYVEKRVAVETNVHESRLHTGEDAGDFSFIDAAD